MKFTILLLTFCLLQIFQVQARYVNHDEPLFPIRDRYMDHHDNTLTYGGDAATEDDTVTDEQRKSALRVVNNANKKSDDGIPRLNEEHYSPIYTYFSNLFGK
ncbi:uncharacterized protein LOC105210615 [Zeugodacus cucurbitae]|uniref:uncharacterized protein LOC105210615 n=1 Tax=Zeugodacus cucurbitae TaxID=28588 RepID=UPI000596A797|nr:uncharacterized protein LOC105210615 [Zeugodacus cucurbitae]